ncbi:hypothetical protein [Candidatus Amarolinea dominans]|uniref:hypothetical protein n=1 Tax=Candidatus Amarolinea dominans TaxID=3140696 RepID=UPI0031346AC9|nr:RHS repeat protein [Anaerolineae bacterium]
MRRSRPAQCACPRAYSRGPASKEFVYAPDQRPAWIKTRQLKDAATSSYLESWGYFDGFGRSLQSQAPLANGNRSVTSTGYNALGQTAYSSAAYEIAAGSGYVAPTWTNLANYVYTTYDELGRTVRNETRSGATQLLATRATYDVWLASSYDANDHRQDAVSDAFGQTTQVLEYNTGGATYTTNYAYDLAGRLTGVTDAAGNPTSIGYNLLGRKTGMTDPDMGSWTYGYDNAGNLTSQKDGANRWLYLEYDALNRLIRKRQDSAAGAILAEWLYDATGQLGLPSKSKAYSSQGTTEVYTVAYDVNNRPTQQQYTVPGTGGGTFRLDTGYTTTGQRSTLRYPGGNAGQQGEVVTYGYNAVAQLASVTGDDGTQYVAATSYNAQGQISEQRVDSGANGFTRQYGYNASTLRLETIKAGTASPWENLQKLTYAYDLAGNVQTLADSANSGQVQTFGYDWLDRLTTAATNAAGVGQYNHTYAYNAIGNLTSYNGAAYTYGTKPHAVTGAFGNAYGYDAVGNQTSRTIGGIAYTQAFDYDNRLLGVAGGGERHVPLRRRREPGQRDRRRCDDRLHRRHLRIPERRGDEVLRRWGHPSHRLCLRQWCVLHAERPVALDERAGESERHGEQPQLLLSLRWQSRRERVQRHHDQAVHRSISRARPARRRRVGVLQREVV